MTNNTVLTIEGGMRRDGEETRGRLLDAALELYATYGFRAVSLKEINARAKQKNSSALHYYFQDRDGLIGAVLMRHAAKLGERRDIYLKEAVQKGDARSAANAHVQPLGELLLVGWRERAFLQLTANLLMDPLEGREKVNSIIIDSRADKAAQLLISRVPTLPIALQQLRLRFGTMMVVQAVADQARLIDASGHAPNEARVNRFISSLVDMYLGMLCAPVHDKMASVNRGHAGLG